MGKRSSGKGAQDSQPRIRNRRARFDYEILEKVECGIALTGTEVKSLRAGHASLAGAFGRIRGQEVFLCQANIAVYPQAVGSLQHDPLRERIWDTPLAFSLVLIALAAEWIGRRIIRLA